MAGGLLTYAIKEIILIERKRSSHVQSTKISLKQELSSQRDKKKKRTAESSHLRYSSLINIFFVEILWFFILNPKLENMFFEKHFFVTKIIMQKYTWKGLLLYLGILSILGTLSVKYRFVIKKISGNFMNLCRI